MSIYFKSLSGDVKTRYLSKIKLIGNVDPYDCDERGFTKELRQFPNVGHGDIYEYLVNERSAYTKNEFKSFKSLKAHKFYACGWVRDIVIKKIGKNVLVLGKVMHSQRMNEKLLQPWLITKPDGEILAAHCTCESGLGEACNHIGAVLFAIADAKAHEPEESVTTVKAKWKVPSGKVAQVGPWRKEIKRRRVIFNHVAPPFTPQEQYEILQRIKSNGITNPLISGSAPHCFELAESLNNCETSNPLRNLFDDEYTHLSLQDLRDTSSHFSFALSQEQITRIEQTTRRQKDSRAWYEQRLGRITASNFKKACSTTIENPAISTIKAICYSKKFTSKATEYGCQHEKDAISRYADISKTGHKHFKLKNVGLMLSMEYPQFGASPDALVSCDCCGEGCVEAKCPYCLKDKTILDNLPAYLKKKADGPFLKRNHGYYYQVQMQMAISGRRYCDFVVWTSMEIFIYRVKFNVDFWEMESGKAITFWRKVILPELYGKYYTRGKPSEEKQQTTTEEQQPSTSAMVQGMPNLEVWCICRQPDDGERMISCDNSSCKIKWFHMKCIGMKNARKMWYCWDCEALGMTPMRKHSSK